MPQKTLRLLPWLILCVVCLGQAAANYAQFQLAPLAPQLIEEMELSTGQFSSVFSAQMIPAIFLSLIAGMLADRFGVKRVIVVGFALTAAAALARIWSMNYTMLFACMFVLGIGICILNANTPKIIGSWHAPHRVGFLTGVVLGTCNIAMVLGTGTTALLPSVQVAYILSAALLVIAFLLFVFVLPGKNSPHTAAVAVPEVGMMESLKVAASSRGVWIAALIMFLFVGVDMMLSPFLPSALQHRGLSPVLAGLYASIINIGSLIGCLVTPALAARIGRYKPLMAILALIAAFGVTFAWRAPLGLPLGAALFCTGLCRAGILPLAMSLPVQLPSVGPKYAGAAGGITATMQLLGAVVIPTYVVAPFAGENIEVFFAASGVCMIGVCALVFLLPEISLLSSARSSAAESGRRRVKN
jgi:NNP family nitrate/nitrite transporter-like MFS transporter